MFVLIYTSHSCNMLIKQVVESCYYFLGDKLFFGSEIDPCVEKLSYSVC